MPFLGDGSSTCWQTDFILLVQNFLCSRRVSWWTDLYTILKRRIERYVCSGQVGFILSACRRVLIGVDVGRLLNACVILRRRIEGTFALLRLFYFLFFYTYRDTAALPPAAGAADARLDRWTHVRKACMYVVSRRRIEGMFPSALISFKSALPRLLFFVLLIYRDIEEPPPAAGAAGARLGW